MRSLCVLLLACSCTCPPVGSSCPTPAPDAGPVGPATWQSVLDDEDLDGAVLSVWGPSPSEVWGAGGSLGNGKESLAVRLKDGQWQRLHPTGTETFWWLHGTASDDVWLVGERGRITHYDGSTFTNHAPQANATMWGVHAFSRSDVWVVGGTPEGGTGAPNDLIFHFDGSAWSREVLPGNPLGASLFKVWGTGDGELFVVGERGTIWHRKVGTWTNESSSALTPGTLFTVHGCAADDVWAVGGPALLHFDGTAWSRVVITGLNGANGVACGSGGQVAVVGFGSLKYRRVDGEFVDESSSQPYTNFHAAWDDGAGTVWISGGDWLGRVNPGQPRPGAIARHGRGTVPTLTSP